ncbi:MAG: YfbM family protein [Pirellulaceae bacterium]
MGCLGVHFALDEDDVDALKSQPSDSARLDYLQEQIEERYFGDCRDWLAESDKAWDAIHRTLTDGTIGWGNGAFPLSHVILGGERIYELDDYIMTLKTPWEVKEIANSLSDVSEDQFREGYFRIDPDDYGFPVNQEDLEYTWSWFQDVHDLYDRAAKANRYVLFTASQ